MEHWKSISFLPPDIEVSDEGRVRLFKTRTEYIILNQGTSAGYKLVSYKGKQFSVHRLVADAFLDDADPSIKHLVVNHRNGKKDDNRAENLEIISQQQNVTSTFQRGTDRKRKLWCAELDKVFGTVRSAAVITGLPQEIVSKGVNEQVTVCGLTFKWIEHNDPLIESHSISYVSKISLDLVAMEAKSVSEYNSLIDKYIEEIKPVRLSRE